VTKFNSRSPILLHLCASVSECGSMEEIRGTGTVLVGKPEGRGSLGRSKSSCEGNSKLNNSTE
jgi:hypothetical protein